MSAEAAFIRAWRVGQYTATLSCPRPQPGKALHAVIEWSTPVVPRLTPPELEAYRIGRDLAFAEMALKFGLPRVAALEG